MPNENISLTDLNMNEYLNELSEYIQNVPEIKKFQREYIQLQMEIIQEFCFALNIEIIPINLNQTVPYIRTILFI